MGTWGLDARRVVALSAVAALALAGLVAEVAVDRKAAYAQQPAPPPAMLNEAVRLAREAWSSCQGTGSEELPGLALPAASVQVIGSDLIQRWLGAHGAELMIRPGAVEIGVSFPLVRWIGHSEGLGWLNLKARLESQSVGLPQRVVLRCGGVSLPVLPWLQRQFLVWASEHQPAMHRVRVISQAIKSLSFEPDVVKLGLRSPQNLMERLRHHALGDVEVAGLRRYHQAL